MVVGGKKSAPLVPSNMVFQGTVWGPTFWNLFYADAEKPVKEAGFTEVVFADDLNAFREVAADLDNEAALAEARQCQRRLHEWGGQTR